MAQLLQIEEVRLKSTRRCGFSQSPHTQEASILLVSCPTPLLEEKGLETLEAFLGQSGMQLALIWAGFLSRNRKNDVVQLP